MTDENHSWHSSDTVGGFSTGPADTDQDNMPDSLESDSSIFSEAPPVEHDYGNLDRNADNDDALQLELDRENEPTDREVENPSDWWSDDDRSERHSGLHTGSPHQEDVSDDSAQDSELSLDLNNDPSSERTEPETDNEIEEIWGDAGYAKDLVPFPDHNFSELDSALTDERGLDELSKVIHGTPDEDLRLWKEQESPMSCAVASTEMLLKSIGINSNESDLADVFEEYGIYDPATGTDPHLIDEVVNKMAETEGLNIHATEVNNFTVDDLTKMLDKGDRPLVCLDSAELYPDALGANERGLEKMMELMDKPYSGHAVQVTGIIQTDEGTMVVLNDPGRPDGAGIHVPLDKFMAASDDFGWTAITISRA